MGVPKKFPKGLDFAGGAIVTLVLEDWQQLTGRFIGIFEDREHYKGPDAEFYKPEGKDWEDKHGDKHKKIDIEVDVEDPEFVVLQLTEAAGVVTLTSALPVLSGAVLTGVTLGITSTSFAPGTFVAVNVEEILYAATSGVTTTFTIPITI